MPLVRIALRRGKSAAYIAALRNGIYAAMRESFNVPENDRFIPASMRPRSSIAIPITWVSHAATTW